MRLSQLITTLSFCGLFLWLSTSVAISQNPDQLEQKKQEIETIKQELTRLQGEKQTLSSTIKYLNGRIQLTQAEINQTEQELQQVKQEIQDLTEKITSLDLSLADLTQQLLHRINSTYKKSRIHPVLTLLTSNNLNSLVSRLKYLQTTQKHNRNLIYQLETARTDFDQQKTLKQQKEEELHLLNQKLESQQLSLAIQQKDKQQLLDLTKNDEKRFQAELSKALAELEAIQAIIAGKGDETQVGDINEGDKIASIIVGASACSSGTHLHFEVVENESNHDPFDYLSSKSLTWDNAGAQDNGHGSWRWPIDEPIRITQDYGVTPYSSRYAGNFHTGVDMVSDSNNSVYSVKNGTLSRGSISCGGGTLRYVKVDHKDSDIDTYYLHINY